MAAAGRSRGLISRCVYHFRSPRPAALCPCMPGHGGGVELLSALSVCNHRSAGQERPGWCACLQLSRRGADGGPVDWHCHTLDCRRRVDYPRRLGSHVSGLHLLHRPGGACAGSRKDVGPMRVFIAGLLHETNTFAPFPTGLQSYASAGIFHGDGSKADTLVSPVLSLWRRRAEELGGEVVESLLTGAEPSGPTLQHVYEALKREILDDLEQRGP